MVYKGERVFDQFDERLQEMDGKPFKQTAIIVVGVLPPLVVSEMNVSWWRNWYLVVVATTTSNHHKKYSKIKPLSTLQKPSDKD